MNTVPYELQLQSIAYPIDLTKTTRNNWTSTSLERNMNAQSTAKTISYLL